MRFPLTASLLLIFTLCAAALASPLTYPTAPRSAQVDQYGDQRVADPFRPLEDPDAPATRAWIRAENTITHKWLASVPQRAAIRRRLTQVWNAERWSVPFRRGTRYFWSHNDGLQNQSVLMWGRSPRATPTVLLDPNKLSTDGTVALNTYSVSEDGNYLAYGLSTAGSDWVEFHVRRVSDSHDLPDRLQWVKFSDASWSADSKGFFYSRYDAPRDPTHKMQEANYYHKLYYHRLGTPQASDVLVYERPDQKEWSFAGTATDDGAWLVINVNQGTDPKNRIFYLNLKQHPIPAAGGRVAPEDVQALMPEPDAEYDFVDNDGSRFWFMSTWKAPRRCVIAVDINHPDPSAWTTVVPQSADTLNEVSRVGPRLFTVYEHDAHSAVRVFELNGKLRRTLPLPALGVASGFPGRRGDHETFYSFTNFTTPSTIYRYDLNHDVSTVLLKPALKFDPNRFETRQIFYHSKDGTRVPMFIVSRKGLRLDGNNPTLLYGYGGFNISIEPAYSAANIVWMEMGGVYAVANIRGGGEYGEAWHVAGTKLKKQNVFDDFIAAAEWLIAHKYTSRQRLAVLGRSNGGLLIGAVLTQRPDLFGATVPGVGVLDMLRFNKFTIGWAWTSDYGSPENPQEFRALYAYSPLHHVKAGTHYPATLIITADHDDRVVPAHSFKFAAALQAAQAGPAPILIRIETRAGHGAGIPTAKKIDEVTDTWAFLVKSLHFTPRLP